MTPAGIRPLFWVPENKLIVRFLLIHVRRILLLSTLSNDKSASVNHLLALVHAGRIGGATPNRSSRESETALQVIPDGPADSSDRIDFKQDERFLATTPYHY